MANDYGVRIKSGANDWQIFQHDSSGKATVSLKGTYFFSEAGKVMVRVVSENTQAPVNSETNWKPAFICPDNTWEAKIIVPAGGLYRIETSFLPKNGALEWAVHGDFVHHIGVGDLWVIAGQSNAVGYGRGEIPDGPKLGVHILRNEEKWDLASHPLGDTRGNNHPNLEGANPGHSPFLVFAKILKEILGYPIGLVQTALGGSALSQWNPMENPEAVLYGNLLHCVNLAGGRVTGVCWYQGCSDTLVPLCNSYLERFNQFVESLRRDLNQPELPFLTAQLNRCYSPQQPTGENQVGWNAVREAQRQAAHFINSVGVIPTIDLTLSDSIHTSPAGNLILGQRFATSALGMCYKKDVSWLFPEIDEAKVRGGGKEVILQFKNVHYQLQSDQPVIEDFTVEDRGGKVEIEKVEFSGISKITLFLARRLEGEGFVHNAYGINPRVSVCEEISKRPLLPFCRFKIKS